MNTCDCKHVAYCKVDSTQCRLVDDPWCKPDKKDIGTHKQRNKPDAGSRL